MRLLVLLSFILLVFSFANGQDESVCKGNTGFRSCPSTGGCNDRTLCFCKDENAFCRCNSYLNEWYLDDDCSFKWTLTTFVLVATLPGLALALLVGVGVGLCVHLPRRSNGAARNRNIQEPQNEEDLFPGVVFASDLNNHSNASPLANTPIQDQVPMTTMPNRTNSQFNGIQSPVNGYNNPYSQSNGMQSPVNRPNNPYSQSNGMQALTNGTTQPYRPGQTISNPYAKDQAPRNPYETRVQTSDPYNDFRGPAPSPLQNGMRAPQQPFAASSYNNPHGQLPRAHIGRPY